MNKEIRTIDNIEFRTEVLEDKKYISGYAFKFDTLSRDLGGFYETINRSAVNDQTDLTDIVALFNHNYMYLLARKSEDANTLEIEVDEIGLKYRFEANLEVSYIRDLYQHIQKRNISKSSFAFNINEEGEKWERKGDKYVREITSFKGIYDVSPVIRPAYKDTDVRNFDEIKSQLEVPQIKEEIDSSEFIYRYHNLKK